MEREVAKLLKETTCSWCRQQFSSTEVKGIKVSRVESQILWEGFAHRRAELMHSLGGKLSPMSRRKVEIGDVQLDNSTNEVFLWHGLPAEKVQIVTNAGFDERV